MFEKDDEKYLKRLIANNQVLLFLGSGFSRDAQNRLGEKFPTGWELGDKIWNFLDYPGEYDGTSLPEMYQAFVGSPKKKYQKIEFLDSTLLSGDIPELYNEIVKPFWYKIYTLNVDDIVEKVFRKEGKGVEELIYPRDEYSERDPSLDNTQIIHLHGMLPCLPDEIIFSTKQYAKSSLAHQPLYAQFVYDYATLPTLFIGTDLNEPLFERYIESREGKGGYRELRPKSYLISPTLSPVKIDNLKNHYNVHHISGTTSDFLRWLQNLNPELPDKKSILLNTFPNLISVLEYSDLSESSTKSLKEFAKSFNRVPKDRISENDRSAFLMGASPRWNDIFSEYDIPRTITTEIYELIEKHLNTKTKSEKTKLVELKGYAGSGKSTILKRLGFMLSQHGRTVFLTYSDFLPRTDHLINVLSSVKERVVIIFDNAKNVVTQLPRLLQSISSHLEYTPIIILGIRTNHASKLDRVLDPDLLDLSVFKIPDLDDSEIGHLITKLDENNLLGTLKGMTPNRRFSEFKYRARKQILVAMKEATHGKPFGDIINSEFSSIEPYEARILCLCIALNTELGFTNSKQDIVGFSKVSHIEALNYLNSVLSGTIMWVGNKDRFMIRHRILADHVIKFCADLEMLKEAYNRVLSVLAPELKKSQGYSKKFNLYKSLINHQVLYKRFKSDINHARELYDSISEFFEDDAHFWLQYGSLEVEGSGGDLTLAENYINQAESLAPDYNYIRTAKCNLYYKLSTDHSAYSYAIDYKSKADELATELILNVGRQDPHIYHIHCRGTYNFVKKWMHDPDDKKRELENLRKIIDTAIRLHPRDSRLETISSAIHRAYLQLGIDDKLVDPEIPN